MPEFARTPEGAAQNLPVRDDPATHARADRDHDREPRTTRRAAAVLTERGEIGVVVDDERQSQSRG